MTFKLLAFQTCVPIANTSEFVLTKNPCGAICAIKLFTAHEKNIKNEIITRILKVLYYSCVIFNPVANNSHDISFTRRCCNDWHATSRPKKFYSSCCIVCECYHS